MDRRDHLDRVTEEQFESPALERAAKRVENAWNSRDPHACTAIYPHDAVWRTQTLFVIGRPMIRDFLHRKWAREAEYRLALEICDRRSAKDAMVAFMYESRDAHGRWHRTQGLERWALDQWGDVERCVVYRIHEEPLPEADRRFRWPLGRRPPEHRWSADPRLHKRPIEIPVEWTGGVPDTHREWIDADPKTQPPPWNPST